LIDATPVDRRAAAVFEAAEARAWRDVYAASPAEFAEAAGLGSELLGGTLVLHWVASGRRYFSRTLGLGVVEPATEEAVDAILDGYARRGISMFLLQSMPHCEPPEYGDWLRERGLEPFDRQDRVVRGREPPAGGSDTALPVEKVTPSTADEWAEFLQRTYHLDTGTWLQRLIGRPGWHEYVARNGGTIVGARGMYIGPDGTAWWGMDAPVPGVHGPIYEPDAALCEFMVADGLANGARRFIADIEAPSDTMDTPAYDYFSRLGFTRTYVRTHWTRL
jgi:hypothetical protein